MPYCTSCTPHLRACPEHPGKEQVDGEADKEDCAAEGSLPDSDACFCVALHLCCIAFWLSVLHCICVASVLHLCCICVASVVHCISFYSALHLCCICVALHCICVALLLHCILFVWCFCVALHSWLSKALLCILGYPKHSFYCLCW